MMPRPRARSKALDVPAHDVLAAAIARARKDGAEPPAIVSDVREWRALLGQPGARDRCQFWPGGEVVFERVPVIIRRGFAALKLMVDHAALDDALLP